MSLGASRRQLGMVRKAPEERMADPEGSRRARAAAVETGGLIRGGGGLVLAMRLCAMRGRSRSRSGSSEVGQHGAADVLSGDSGKVSGKHAGASVRRPADNRRTRRMKTRRPMRARQRPGSRARLAPRAPPRAPRAEESTRPSARPSRGRPRTLARRRSIARRCTATPAGGRPS